MRKLPITVIIPTWNEEKNIANAINSVKYYVDQIIVADTAHSTDATLSQARGACSTVEMISIRFSTFAQKMNIALESSLIRNEWVMRLDADEVVYAPESFFGVLLPALVRGSSGIYCNRRYYFLGKWVRHGGMYPRKVLRIFRRSCARFEDRLIDEKVIMSGETEILDIDIADICQKGFWHWVSKHIAYAKREAKESRRMLDDETHYDLDFDTATRENKKLYYRAPIFVRPALYFIYRLFFQMGIADGATGILYHFMHAFVYREAVDFFILKNKVADWAQGR
ncbi:MAG: glycosyltransferase family 2 protein [Elusimicrobiota bacterium]